MEPTRKPGAVYRLFKSYIRFYHDKVCYTRTYNVDTENVPAPGTPLLIVSNHQNGVSDPLGIVMSFRDRKPHVLTRADVFALHPVANRFLRAIGLLPAFRIDHEGEESLSKNADTFKISERALLDGETVAMYPEAGHQDKRWLGTFSYGYTKLAFEAAEMGNFEKEIFILPSCNHYSNYFGIRNQLMIKYGTPISLAPYYELYKTKPRTAQREVNKLVREQISGLMLDVRDVDNYDSIDFLRETYGARLAEENSCTELPDRLISDKKFVAALAQTKEDEPEKTQALYDDAVALKTGIERLGIADRHFDKAPSAIAVSLKLLAAMVLLPVALFTLWPTVIMWGAAYYFADVRMKDRMMESTFLIALSVLFWIPIFSVLTFVLAGLFISWWAAAAWVLLFPAIFIFAQDYANFVKRLVQDIKFLSRQDGATMASLRSLRKSIYGRLDNIFRNKK
ncbi:MAG: 1-acyl-sn-glycerol-3-phosphate acyltransferase [Clostridium sp.]|nr:1-acyl-sn-glycerol-3-phosphate acyltransferase [Bacteroides sp.]MCM1198641.1 1-acyl-sn-glycerol-3-phosphate acyltransferase [Clostridium sp.]